jgi:hypothetical protein
MRTFLSSLGMLLAVSGLAGCFSSTDGGPTREDFVHNASTTSPADEAPLEPVRPTITNTRSLEPTEPIEILLAVETATVAPIALGVE